LERDRYGYVEFVDMQSVPVLFDEKPSFSELVARAWKEVHCHEDDDIAVEDVLHLGSPPNLLRKMIPIRSADQWEKYVRFAMKRQLQSLDVVVRRVLVDPIPHGFFPAPMAQQAYFDPPAFAMEAEVASTVPDAQSARNEVRVAMAVVDASGSHDVVAEPPQEIPLTQNHPSKYLFRIVS
jgi:hypothetical protein